MRIDPNSLFDSDTEIGESSSESSDEEDPVTNDRKYYSNLSVEDDFLLVLMKLRLGLSTLDLAVRFQLYLNFSQLGLIIYMYVSVI